MDEPCYPREREGEGTTGKGESQGREAKDEVDLFKSRTGSAEGSFWYWCVWAAFVCSLHLTRLPPDLTVPGAYDKAGQCDEGNKYKYSHDLNLGRMVEKADL
jgi:hypothetical protein